jgi:hypothetical protein
MVAFSMMKMTGNLVSQARPAVPPRGILAGVGFESSDRGGAGGDAGRRPRSPSCRGFEGRGGADNDPCLRKGAEAGYPYSS